MAIRYAHTNLVSEDWQNLARFYQTVFHCEPLAPIRDISAPWLQQLTGIPDAQLQGIHLRLPGYGENGPTLEIFTYTTLEENLPPAANRKGLAHIAFAVDDVEATLEAVIAAGGRPLGEIVTTEIAGAGTLTLVYATDPEGNIIELQKWH